jgi:hypothetical protein
MRLCERIMLNQIGTQLVFAPLVEKIKQRLLQIC